MNRRNSIGLLTGFVLVLMLSMVPVDAYWNASSFSRRVPIDLYVSTAPTKNADYPVMLTIPYDADMQADFDDLRFRNGSENRMLEYWIESKTDSSTANVWIKPTDAIPLISTNITIYMYYGCASCGNQSDIQMFLIGDDFNGAAVNSTYWAVSGTPVVSGSTVTVAAGEYLSSEDYEQYHDAHCTRFYGSVADDGLMGFRPKTAGTRDASIRDSSNALSAYSYDGSSEETTAITDADFGDWRTYEVCRNTTTNVLFYMNDTLIATHTNPFATVTGAKIWDYDSGSSECGWMIVRNYSFPEPGYTIGAEEVNINPPTLTMVTPTNATYLDNGVSINFTAIDDSLTHIPVDIYLDGAFIRQVNLTNDTYHTSFLGTSAAAHNIMVAPCDAGECDNTTTFFTVVYHNITTSSFNTTPYETSQELFNITVATMSNSTLVEAELIWNSTNYGNDSSSGGDSFGQLVQIPLLSSNATDIYAYWNITVTWNDTTQTNYNEDVNQTVLFGYYTGTITGNNYHLLGSDTLDVGVDFYYHVGDATTTMNLRFNNTDYPMSDSVTAFNRSVVVPNITTNSVNFTYYSTLTTTFNSTTREENTSDEWVVVYNPTFTDCAGGGLSTVKVLNFTFYDEEYPTTSVNSTMEITLELSVNGTVVNTHSFDFTTANDTHYICLYPGWANFTVEDAQIQFEASGYVTRTYYLFQAAVSNTTDEIYLYNLNTTSATATTFTLEDQNGIELSNVRMRVLRYYIGSNSYRTVTIVETDTNGETVANLVHNNVFYEFIVQQDGSTLEVIEPMLITDTEISFIIGVGTLLSNFDFAFQGYGSCTYNDATYNLRCTVSDRSGLMTEGCLVVWEVGPLTEELYNQSCESSAAFTVGSTLQAGTTYHYAFYGTYDGETYLMVSGFVEETDVPTYSSDGLILSAMMVSATAFSGVYSPLVAIILTLAALGFSVMIDLISIQVGTIMGLIVGALLLILRGVRDR